LARISSDPIIRLVNTHWHFDHTDGNEWLHTAGAVIVAHEKTRQHLTATVHVDDWDFTFPPSPAGALPTAVFQDRKMLHINGSMIDLQHYPPAHTDCDISVHFSEADILCVGDTWWNGVYPFIDYSTGGSIDGMIRATKANLDRASTNTVLIPGHGPVGSKSDMAEFYDMLVAIRATVAVLKKQGRSLSDAIAAKPTAAYDATLGSLVPPDLFIQLVYEGV
jgi:glyoxylase-like metal-dependent hydrolase (beta-lactamase superfamily II)